MGVPRHKPEAEVERGFRLGELMVVVAIIAVLVALLLPDFRRSSGPALRRAHCTNNLKQIALALFQYEQVHHALPPAHTVDAEGRPLHSWRTPILPYLEQNPLYQTIDLSKPWTDPVNAKAREAVVDVFRCPGAPGRQNTTHYLANAGPDGCFMPTNSRRLPRSQTLMIQHLWWSKPVTTAPSRGWRRSTPTSLW